MTADPLEWLLGKDNLSVQNFALCDLLEYPDTSAEMQSLKDGIRRSPTVAKIFAGNGLTAIGGDLDQPYHPKYRATCWQIMLLSHLGLDKTDPRVTHACDAISPFQLADGGFTTVREAGAAWEYRWVAARRRPPCRLSTASRPTSRRVIRT